MKEITNSWLSTTAHEKDKETLTSGESKGVNKEDKRKREGKVLRVLCPNLTDDSLHLEIDSH